MRKGLHLDFTQGVDINEELLEGSIVGDTQLLAKELESFREFSSGDMQSSVLRVLLKSLHDWVSSVGRRYEDATLHSTFSRFAFCSGVSASYQVITHVNVNSIIIVTPLSSI